MDPTHQLDPPTDEEQDKADDDDVDMENDYDEPTCEMTSDDGEEHTKEFDPGGNTGTMAIIDPNDLIGRTYLTPPAENGQ